MDKEKLNNILQFYYSRKDIQGAILKFCQDRETVPRYFEGFGKRPDMLQFPADILSQVKAGATSFHCSEELWQDPLQISTELTKEQLDSVRRGWDLLIDIDCKYFDYSKKAARAILESLKSQGVNHFSIKYSGSKGFHIIVPWKAFPKEVNNIKTKDMFPEWPRTICEYLKFLSRDLLEQQILESGEEYKRLGDTGVQCKNCGNLAEKFFQLDYYCERCRIKETIKVPERKFIKPKSEKNSPIPEVRKCAHCRKPVLETSRKEFHECKKCQMDSRVDKSNFSASIDVFSILGLDLVLVSSRHLFRAPYSLHEKTAFSSIVLLESELESFNPQDASPLKVKIRDFYPEPEPGEARRLLINALEWNGSRLRSLESREEKKEKQEKKYQEIEIDKSSLVYPPSIKKILEGMADGRKRALFILLNFYRSLNFTREETEKKIEEWNKKNPKPLKIGYIKSQVEWTFRQKKMLPPNFDKPFWKDIGIQLEDEELKFKNPVSYAARKSRRLRR